MNYSITESRNVALLRNIVYGEHNPIVDPLESTIEEILMAILSGEEYTGSAENYKRMERILIAISKGETITDMVPRSRNEEILLTKMAGNDYTKAPQSQIEEILIDWDLESASAKNALAWASENEEGMLIYSDGNATGVLVYEDESEESNEQE